MKDKSLVLADGLADFVAQEYDGMPFDLLLVGYRGEGEEVVSKIRLAINKMVLMPDLEDADDERLKNALVLWGPVVFPDGIWMHVEDCYDPSRGVEILQEAMESEGLSGELTLTYKRDHQY